MESLNALLRKAGLMHLLAQASHHAAGEPAVAGDSEEVLAVVAAADWLRRAALQHPGSGWRLTALEYRWRITTPGSWRLPRSLTSGRARH